MTDLSDAARAALADLVEMAQHLADLAIDDERKEKLHARARHSRDQINELITDHERTVHDLNTAIATGERILADALRGEPARATEDDLEALASKWLANYHGSIDATALTLSFKAGYTAGGRRQESITDEVVEVGRAR